MPPISRKQVQNENFWNRNKSELRLWDYLNQRRLILRIFTWAENTSEILWFMKISLIFETFWLFLPWWLTDRRGLETCPQAQTSKSGHAIFLSFFRPVSVNLYKISLIKKWLKFNNRSIWLAKLANSHLQDVKTIKLDLKFLGFFQCSRIPKSRQICQKAWFDLLYNLRKKNFGPEKSLKFLIFRPENWAGPTFFKSVIHSGVVTM